MKGAKRISARELPAALSAELAAARPLEVRAHPDSRPDRPWAWLLPIAVAATTFGGLHAVLVPGEPFSQNAAWIALFAGAPLLGALVGAARRSSLRPRRGQGMLVGPTSLVIVDHAHVEVLPAENLTVSDGEIRFQGEPIDSAERDPEWLDALRAAIQAASRGGADPWREAATDAAPDPSRRGRAAIGAAAGLVLAAGLELAPLPGPVDDPWPGIRASFERQTAFLERHERELYERQLTELKEQLAGVETTDAAVPIYLDVQSRNLGDEFTEPATERLHELARRELEAATTTEEVLPLLKLGADEHLSRALREQTEEKFLALTEEELENDPTAENFDRYLLVGRQVGLGAAYHERLVDKLVAHARPRVAAARAHGEVRPYLELCWNFEVPADLCDAARDRYVALARTALPRADTDELVEIEDAASRGDLGALEGPLSARQRVLSRSAIASASSGEALEQAVSVWMNRVGFEVQEELEALAQRRAEKLAASVETSRQAKKLLPFFGHGEARDRLYARYRDLAAEEARTGGISQVQAFLDAPDFRDHPARAEIERRLSSLCEDAFGLVSPLPDDVPEEVAFYSSLIVKLCKQNTRVLPFRVTRFTQVEDIEQAAPPLADSITEITKILGTPMTFQAKQSSGGRALIELDVTGFAPRFGATSYPCTLHISRLYEAPGPETLDVESRCVVEREWKRY